MEEKNTDTGKYVREVCKSQIELRKFFVLAFTNLLDKLYRITENELLRTIDIKQNPLTTCLQGTKTHEKIEESASFTRKTWQKFVFSRS